MPSPLSAVSIIVPTFREAANIKPLVERVFAATRGAGIEAELILVDDDSQDGTEAVVGSLRSQYLVRLIVRRAARGLSSAVLAGFEEAEFDRFVVLDADLQHPPEMIPALLSRLDESGCDFAVATRYGGEGFIDPTWPFPRRWASRLATLLARPLAPLSDPMSGFFALHRRTWERAAKLDPIGYKIALELYVKAGCRRPGEVPIRFAARQAGASKLSSAVAWRCLLHLGRLYWFRFPLATVGVVTAGVSAVIALVLWLIGIASSRG